MKLLVGFCFKIFSFLLTSLPIRVRLFLGDLIGWLWFDVLRIRRQVAIDNVAIAFPELSLSERTRIARESLKSMGRTIIEFASFPFFSKAVADRTVVFKNRETLDRALSGGKGVILLAMHIGNGDYGVSALSADGYKVNLISKEFKSKWLNDLWFGMRKKIGTRFISVEKSSFDILKALRRNEIVIFVLDQFMGPPVGVRTRFFGKETGTAAGLALIAGRTGVPVVPCYTYRMTDGRHCGIFEEPIPFVANRSHDESIAIMTQAYTDAIEKAVRKKPEQWMWIHRRWKEFRD